ncbi:MAG: glycosyltransferase [Acidimicrobiia bacterium]|nr:glycosyltransferase [Acidimicrobiia bacterium]
MPAPRIDVIETADRPRWSVMIPAWNAEGFLAETIASVLDSDLPKGSQIEVIDDCSTDATSDVVNRFVSAGVGYFRHTEQQGAVANFNACLARSRGEFVHLLHADDLAVAGFYTAAQSAFGDSPAIASVCRTQYVDEAGLPIKVTRSESATGLWKDAVQVLAISNRVRPPGIAVRRSAYETVGGFMENLPHAADWEMWARLSRHGPIWFEDRILARYRVHEGQDTSGRVVDASNIADRVDALEIIAADLPDRDSLVRKGLLYTAVFAARTSWNLARQGSWTASGNQLKAAARAGLAGATGRTSLARRVST